MSHKFPVANVNHSKGQPQSKTSKTSAQDWASVRLSKVIVKHLEEVFSFRQFATETFTHVLWPFNYPVVRCYKTWNSLRAQNLVWNWDDPSSFIRSSCMFGYFLPLCGWSAFILSRLYASEIAQHGVQTAELLAPMFFMVAHRACIGFKYGMLHPSEYRRLMAITDVNLSSKYLSQLNILTGWIYGMETNDGKMEKGPNEILLAAEVVRAAQKSLIRAEKAFFHVDGGEDEVMHWNEMLSRGGRASSMSPFALARDSIATIDGNEAVKQVTKRTSAYQDVDAAQQKRQHLDTRQHDGPNHHKRRSLARLSIPGAMYAGDKQDAVLRLARDDSGLVRGHRATVAAVVEGLGLRPLGKSWLGSFLFIIPLLRVTLPFVHRSVCGDISTPNARPVFASAPTTAAVVLALICLFAFYNVITMFVYGSYVHIARHRRMVSDLNDLVRLNKDERPNHPILDMTLPANVRSWLYARIMVQDLGSGYSKRLYCYSSIVLFVVAFMQLEVILGFAAVLSGQVDQEHMRCSLIDWMSLYDILAFGTLFAVQIATGLKSNESLVSVKTQFIKHRVRLRDDNALKRRSSRRNRILSEAEIAQEREDEEACDDLLDTAIISLEAMHEENPVRILGVDASRALLVSLFTSIASVIWMWGNVATTGELSFFGLQ